MRSSTVNRGSLKRRVLAVLLVLMGAEPCRAGGLFLPVHGVRALGRGGTSAAGGDDPAAMWFNPATLDVAAGQGLFEGVLISGNQRYRRIDSGGNEYGEVASMTPLQAAPTAATVFRLPRRFSLGAAFSSPYGLSPRYRPDGPQRYSLIDLDGTFIARVELGVAYRILENGPDGPRLAVGLSLQDTLVNFEARTVLNACPGTVVAAPEDPECDSRVRFRMGANFNVSGHVGGLLSYGRLRTGLAVQLPTWVSGWGTIEAGIPTHPLFRHEDGSVKATQEGDRAKMTLRLPWVLRAAVEYRFTPRLRAEAGLDYEGWSLHDAIRVTPKDIKLTNLNGGVPEYEVGPVTIWRKFRDTVAVRTGAEWDVHPLVVLRGGIVYESAAPPPKFLSLLSVDMPKVAITAGFGLRPHPAWRIDGGYAFISEWTTTVPLVADPSVDTASCQLAPIRPEAPCVQVNAGTYKQSVHVGGLSVTYAF